MWRPATREVTGTNDSTFLAYIGMIVRSPSLAPLGNRRRFGPAPTEETAPPQLAQPSPSAYPRPHAQNDRDSSRSDRGETPQTPNGSGTCPFLPTRLVVFASSLMAAVAHRYACLPLMLQLFASTDLSLTHRLTSINTRS